MCRSIAVVAVLLTLLLFQTAVASANLPQTVFVDKNELARLHPGWQALDDMRAALDSEKSDLAKNTSSGSLSPAATVGSKRGLTVVPSRSQLVAKAAGDASASLDKLEKRKYDALRARRDSMSVYLLKNSESEWKAEARTIQEEAAIQMKAVDEQYAVELLNARLRATATKSAVTISQKQDGGLDKADADARLITADAEVQRIKADVDAQKAIIDGDARARIAAIKEASEKRVKDILDLYETDQSTIIANSMASARSDIARTLGPTAAPGLFAEYESGFNRWVVNGSACAGNKTTDLKAAICALQERIDNDVNTVVLVWASQKGLKVTFERSNDATYDATKMFADIIKKRGWNAVGPMAGGLESS